MARRKFLARSEDAMNKLKRLMFGVLSSLLLAVGFVQAANHLDPMSRTLGVNSENSVASTAPDCSSYCDVHDAGA